MAGRWWTRAVVGEAVAAPAIALRRVAQVRADLSYRVPDHDYPFARWIACRTLGGSGRMTIGDGPELDLGPDSVVLMRQADLRRFHCRQAPWHVWWFEFLGEHHLPVGRVLTVPAADEVAVYSACLRLLTSPAPANRRLASARFAAVLAGWGAALGPDRAAQDRVDRVLAAMHDRPDGSLGAAEMATIAGVGSRRLRQLFLAAVGSPPGRHYAALRAELAGQLLRDYRRPAEEVAATLGYADRFALTRALKTHLGTTPGRLRRLG